MFWVVLAQGLDVPGRSRRDFAALGCVPKLVPGSERICNEVALNPQSQSLTRFRVQGCRYDRDGKEGIDKQKTVQMDPRLDVHRGSSLDHSGRVGNL